MPQRQPLPRAGANYPTVVGSWEREGEGEGERDEVGSGAIEPAEAEGEEAEGGAVGAFEDAAEAVLEDEGALDEDEEGGELEDEEEAVHVGRVADAAGIPGEAGGLVVAEARLLVHAVAVLVAADPGRGEVGDEQPGLVVAPPPDGDDVDGAPAGLE